MPCRFRRPMKFQASKGRLGRVAVGDVVDLVDLVDLVEGALGDPVAGDNLALGDRAVGGSLVRVVKGVVDNLAPAVAAGVNSGRDSFRRMVQVFPNREENDNGGA